MKTVTTLHASHKNQDRTTAVNAQLKMHNKIVQWENQCRKDAKWEKSTQHSCKKPMHWTEETGIHWGYQHAKATTHAMAAGCQKQKQKRSQKQRTGIAENADSNHDHEKTLNANNANCMDMLGQIATCSTESTGVCNASAKIHLKQN